MESLSYREVIPTNSCHEEWHEITLNTGGTHSTLQDIKIAEKAGGYCFKNVSLNHNRNRYIYWRSYQDILELTEISLDFNLYQNNLRYKFTDTPVLAVTINENADNVVLLVSTVCSLHRICFPHPDTLADGSCSSSSCSNATGTTNVPSVEFNDSQSYSIFFDASVTSARDPSSFYVIDSLSGPSNNHVPHAACSYLSTNGKEAYFALACQNQLMLYTMNCSTGHTISHQLKEHNIMPRLFSNLKGALIGKTDTSDADHANSIVFTCINSQILLLALYRNDHLRVWSTINMQSVCAVNCVREGTEQRMQGLAELRRQVALENLQNQRLDNYDQDVPVEFECCFCTSKDFKEFTDAEGVIALPTSDFHKPICYEMRQAANRQLQQSLPYGHMAIALPSTTAIAASYMPSHMQALQMGGGGIVTAATGTIPSELLYSASSGGVMRTSLPYTATGIAPISQSSSTSSSYGTTTSTTIALPLDMPLRYPPFVTSSSSAAISNFNHNFNNNFNTTSLGTCHPLSMSTSQQGVTALGNNFSNNNLNNFNNNNADLASVDSSDTYASCQTHPFLSQGDLTSDLNDEVCALDIDMDNLYINPLEKDSAGNTTTGYMVGLPPTPSSGQIRAHVKKSASGDTALRNLAAGGLSPMDDVYQNFDTHERGSHISLNENPVPKHRKTRFQQSFSAALPSTQFSSGTTLAPKPRARFEDSKLSQENLGSEISPASSTGKKKRSSFMPGKSLATATKLINQHLFGIQNVGPKAKFESKHSSSIDSIDASPNLEHHRRSKSILKNKSDVSRVLADPESERLLADNMSGSGVSDNGTVMGESGSDYSPNKLPHSVLAKSISPPPLRHRTLMQQRSGPASLQSKPTKFQTPRYPAEEQALRQAKPVLARAAAASHMSGDSSRYDSTNRDSSLDSETTFTSNVNLRGEAVDSGNDGSGDAGGSSDENRSLLQRDNSNERNDDNKADSSGPKA